RGAHEKQAKRLGTDVEQLCVDAGAEPAQLVSFEKQPAPKPAPAGNLLVLHELKRFLGMFEGDSGPPSTLIEPDRFSLLDDSPLWEEHELLSILFEEVVAPPAYQSPDLSALKAGRIILKRTPPELARILLAAAERHIGSVFAPSINNQEI